MKLGTSVRFLFPTSPATHERFRGILASMPKGAFIERPLGAYSAEEQAGNLMEVASAARALQVSFVTAIAYLILVAVVVVTYFIQQRQITARNKNNPNYNANPAAAQQQMIMKIFPIFSGVFSFIVPAALAWYFLVQNLFRIGQQAYITKRFYREHPDAIAARQGTSTQGSGGKPAKSAGTGTTNTAAKKGGRGAPAKGTPPKAKPTPSASGNGKRRAAPKPPPRTSGSTPKPPARPRPQKKKP